METLRSRLRGAWASRSQNIGRAVRVWAKASAITSGRGARLQLAQLLP